MYTRTAGALTGFAWAGELDGRILAGLDLRPRIDLQIDASEPRYILASM